MKREFSKIPVWITYTLAFMIVVALSFGALRTTGHTTIWSLDGIAQHYPILKEFYQILHGTANQNLFSWSWNLGLGADQMTTFAYYVVGDPFSYLIALFPFAKIELGYTLLTILRLYVVGLSFIALAKHFHFRRVGTLVGALVYTFNGFAFYVSYHHPFFLLPLILFPLLCLTIDNVLQGKSWWWLAITTGIVLIANVYFAYLLAIGAVLFTIVRYIDLKNKRRPIPNILPLVGRLLLAIILGVAVSAVILLPNVLAMLNSSRVGGANFANGLKLYPEIYYRTLPESLLTSNGTIYYWAIIATSGLSLIAIVWSLRRFRRYLALNLTLFLIVAGLIFPAVAATLNVLSTPSNRWLLMAQLVFALLAAIFTDHLTEFDKRDFFWLTGVTIVLIATIWFANSQVFHFREIQLMTYVVFMLIIWLMSLVLIIPNRIPELKLGLVMLVMLNAVVTGLSFYSDNYSGAPANELPTTTASQWSTKYFDGADRYLNKVDKHFYRTSTSNDYYTMLTVGNDIPMLLNTHTISSYFSVQDGDVNTFNKQLANSQNSMNNPTSGVDSRTTMLSLLGVKYLFARQDDVANQGAAPYGFNLLKTKSDHDAIVKDKPVYSVGNGTGTAILKNKYALPLAYMQTTQINPGSFSHATPLNRQEALLSGAVLDKPAGGIKQTKVTSATKKVPYQVALTSLPATTIPDAINYRLAHNTKTSPSASVGSDLTPKEAMKYAAATNLEQPASTVQKLLAQNQEIIDNNNERNKNQLRTMTSDVLGENQTYQLKLKHPKTYQGTELYLDLSGISATFPNTTQRLAYETNQSKLAGTPLTNGQQANNRRKIINNPLFDSYVLNISTGRGKTTFTQLGINNMSDYEQKHHLLINLGYSTHLRKTINLSFTGASSLNFKKVKVIALPYGARYRQKTSRLQQAGLSQQKVTNNRVSGISTVTKRSILTTSIPYSTGWQLTVDGQPRKTQVVNSGFVGAVIPGGAHQIKLTYKTPGLKEGRLITLISAILLLIFGTWHLLRRYRL